MALETSPSGAQPLHDKGLSLLDRSPFMLACRRLPVPYTPIWLMRQAGRYMPEYRELREKIGFLELCKNPELACQVTVSAAERLGVDAAILFADILLVLEPLGFELAFSRGEGPVIANPLRTVDRVSTLRHVDCGTDLGYVLQTVRMARMALPAGLPLIGFSGAPFTLASYMIEGGASRHFTRTKAFMLQEPEAWDGLMVHLSKTVTEYLCAQITNGAQAVQIFDSWVGCLSPGDYRTFVLPHMTRVIAGLPRGVPVIHFGVGTASLLELMAQAGSDVMGLDFHVELDEGWRRVGDVAVQGNLDPAFLFTDRRSLTARIKRILDQAEGRVGHIFNLGHGVLPTTSVDSVLALVEIVHDLSRR